jgi:hypothetical protein
VCGAKEAEEAVTAAKEEIIKMALLHEMKP